MAIGINKTIIMNRRRNELLQIAFHCVLPLGPLAGVPCGRCRSLEAKCNGGELS